MKPPFLAVPFDAPQREAVLAQFNVTAIPRLVLLGPDGRVLVDNAVGMPQSGLSVQAIDAWLKMYS